MQKNANSVQDPDPDQLLTWYDQNGRNLPWRRPSHLSHKEYTPDPYKIWLSEIMLQQTTVVTVKPYFEKFITTWPTILDFASSPLDQILAAWAGLGYYTRARNMHKCATMITHEQNGQFPSTEQELLKLPGVGPYTAAAISAIAFNQRATILDGNVERVMARHYSVSSPLPKAKPELRQLADRLTPSERPGDYAQAIMDLGATICRPKNPSCLICPWQTTCTGRLTNPIQFPFKKAKKQKPTRYGYVLWQETPNQHIVVEKRPEKGLLGGMIGFPGSDWTDCLTLPQKAQPVSKIVKHTFTHFHLELTILKKSIKAQKNQLTIAKNKILTSGLPIVMRKVATTVLEDETT